MVRILEERASRDPGSVFYTWADTVTTVGDFNTTVNVMARNLQDVGVTQQTHVLVLMDNSPDYLALWFAIAKLGAVEVPVNTAYHGAILQHQIVTGAATVAVVDEAYAERIAALGDAIPALRDVVVRGVAPRTPASDGTTSRRLVLRPTPPTWTSKSLTTRRRGSSSHLGRPARPRVCCSRITTSRLTASCMPRSIS
ncbi:AMP-binding protein [Aeromicrobium sp. UC242_57]